MEEEAQVFKLATTSSKANAATVDYFLIKVKTILKRGGSDAVLDLMTDDIPLPETVEICQIKERIFKSKSSPAHSKSTF